jgi:hypothetical protein
MFKREVPRQSADVQPLLKEVIEASETMELAHIRQAALAAIEDLKRKGPGDKRDMSTWGQVGQGVLAAGCVAAAATGQVEFGLPCVVGGALGELLDEGLIPAVCRREIPLAALPTLRRAMHVAAKTTESER